MNRGEVRWAHAGSKRRPVLVLTRSEVIDVRELVTVAEITTAIRGLAVEVPLDATEVNFPSESVINCDGLHTVRRASLGECVGELGETTMGSVCRTIAYALSC
ncbi:type II toxin-antitoxin system PemK/MazF family toxin [Candidatus Poriferisodalis sp.]|uniref:type II toxin-antitoxin system PemK/MazF family toxin n=1 Tax=Candidatus Poriferisodalis sp. TaxID=3101277 RepID=UPI003B5C1F38